MAANLEDLLQISPEVEAALQTGQAVVALESTVISHGLPHPQNLELARRCETVICEQGAVPATVGIIDGHVIVGLTGDQLEILATAEKVRKVSRRDFGIAIARKEHGATTVAGTMIAARIAGVRMFATGGIGGVHRGNEMDISADLPELEQTSVAVVCAGAKAILDLPRTLEWLETAGVPVIGYQTETFPAFYSSSSGLPVDICASTPEEVAAIIDNKWSLGLKGGVLVTIPPPADMAMDQDEIEQAIEQALDESRQQAIRGKAVTPFLLSRISALTEGRSLAVNLALLEQNARIAAQIAVALEARE